MHSRLQIASVFGGSSVLMPGQRGKSRAPGRAEGRVPLAAAAVVALVRGYPLRPLFSQKPSLSSRAQPTCPSDTRYAMHDAPPAVPLRRPPVRLAKGIGSEVHQSRGSPWRRKKRRRHLCSTMCFGAHRCDQLSIRSCCQPSTIGANCITRWSTDSSTIYSCGVIVAKRSR